jgi:hypothetical protein
LHKKENPFFNENINNKTYNTNIWLNFNFCIFSELYTIIIVDKRNKNYFEGKILICLYLDNDSDNEK